MTAEGVVGVPEAETAPPTAEVVGAVRSAGGEPRVAPPAELAAAHLAAIVAPGESSFRALARAAPGAPVLPVDCAAGVRAVPAAALEDALAELLERGPAATDEHAVLDVAVDGASVGRAVRQVTVVTAEPAGISEFAVEAAGAGRVDEVRADGVVVATPAGSVDYAAAGGGPLCAPGTGLAVVPVAPFRVERTRWVLPDAGCSVSVCRDETPVAVEVDGEVGRTVECEATVRVEREATVETAVVEASGATFE